MIAPDPEYHKPRTETPAVLPNVRDFLSRYPELSEVEPEEIAARLDVPPGEVAGALEALVVEGGVSLP